MRGPLFLLSGSPTLARRTVFRSSNSVAYNLISQSQIAYNLIFSRYVAYNLI